MQIVPVPSAVETASPDAHHHGASATGDGTGVVADTSTAGFTAVDFALAAQALAERCRSIELQSPDFRSPPQVLGLTRTLRRRSDGSVTVAVAFKNRPPSGVLADMIEGVIAANELGGVEAARARDDLWSGLAVRIANAA